MKHRISIERNAEGDKLAYMAPIPADGVLTHGYRVAGPKACGGSKTLAEIDIADEDLAHYIRVYAPNVVAELKATCD